jgi:HEAT repeat protein
VRAAAVRALDAEAATGLDARIEPFADDADPELRGAAVAYLLTRGQSPIERAHAWLDGPDEELRRLTLETLIARRRVVPGAITPQWVDARLERATETDLVAAALGLALVPGPEADERLRRLIEHPNVEVRRYALITAARRPVPALLEAIVAQLPDPALKDEAREAVAALRQAAIPALAGMADGSQGATARRIACEALSRVGGRSAIAVLLRVVRGNDPDARYDAFRALNRLRARSSTGLIKKSLAFRLWQRELDEYRDNLLPAFILHGAEDPRVVLLGNSFSESADRSLDRACRALACYYRPEPFRSVYQYLHSGSPKTAARALEYLSHLLPRKLFGALRETFEETTLQDDTEGAPNDGQVAGCIERAWEIGDTWLRACAVRAAHALTDRIPIEFPPRTEEPDLVREELAVYHAVRPVEEIPA